MCCFEIFSDTLVEGLRWLSNLGKKRCFNPGGPSCITVLKQQRGEKIEGDEYGTAASAGGSLDDSDQDLQYNIIVNPKFSEGTRGWVGEGCLISTVGTCIGSSSSYCVAHERSEKCHGLAQEIGKRLDADVTYRVEAWVGIRSNDLAVKHAAVHATVKVVRASNGGDGRLLLSSSVEVKRGEWCLLTGILRGSSDQQLRDAIVMYMIDGPDGGVDILVSSVAIVPTSTTTSVEIGDRNDEGKFVDCKLSTEVAGLQVHQDYPDFDVNIVANSDLSDGLHFWYAMGNCTLAVVSGGPTTVGAVEEKSSVHSRAPVPSLSGNYIYCSNRTETFEGPAQDLTDQIQLFQCYRLIAWVATSLPFGTTVVDVSLEVDGEWKQGGEALVGLDWIQIRGAFRLEKEFKKLVVYLQGPEAGIDVMLTGLQIFAVDRLARTPALQTQTEKIRKRDVILKLRDSEGHPLPSGTAISVQQTRNSFPIGSCISLDYLEDGFYTKFFLDNFNFGVFENELKWDQIQPEEGDDLYKDADILVRFCNSNKIPMRGHCIVWDTDRGVPDWVQELEGKELLAVIEKRVTGLLTRYKGQFEHYDVNNEMLHGDFYEEKLGTDFLPYLFKLCHRLDSHATLFVNDYDVANDFDCTSSPERYVELISFLQKNGAAVGGIGVQGHIVVPIGSLLADTLDTLGSLNLPIWLTEVDVSSLDENVRAADLEVILREAFAHPAVEGILLWGFLENTMARENAFLVNSDYTMNAAGQRLLDLKKEWTTSFEAVLDGNGELFFRGFHGNYTFSVDGKLPCNTFDVTIGDGSLLVNVAI